MRLRSERGLTLIELVVVGVLATMVMLALTGFYVNSQRTWLEGSSQALTQREATLVTEQLADRVREASSAWSTGVGLHHTLTLYGPVGETLWQYALDPADSLLHEYEPDQAGVDNGPIVSSIVNRFQVTTGDSLVELTVLELRSASGDLVRIGSTFALYNR